MKVGWEEFTLDSVIRLPAFNMVFSIVCGPERLSVFHKVTQLEDGTAELISRSFQQMIQWWAGQKDSH